MDLLAHNGVEHATNAESVLHYGLFSAQAVLALIALVGVFVMIYKYATRCLARQVVPIKKRGR